MITTWEHRCPLPPKQHQRDGVDALLRRPIFMLADEVGGGKTKQVIDAAQLIFESGEIDLMLVLCPAFARGVWANPNPLLGEIAKHSWPDLPYACREYSILNDDMTVQRGIYGTRRDEDKFLRWVVSNYEFVRREERLHHLLKYISTKRFWLVCDESWALKDQDAVQWKATYTIRKLARRVTLLNGTPVVDTPMDLNAQMKMLDPRILGFPYLDRWGRQKISTATTRFREHYAVMNPNTTFPTIVGWQNLEELRAKVSPYVLRRATRDCFDLPDVLEPIIIEAKLDESWRLYQEMKKDMIAWLDEHESSIAQQAIVKGLRLAQITSGFLGGVRQFHLEDDPDAWRENPLAPPDVPQLKEVGREKLNALLKWLETLEPSPARILIWARFRAEIERTAAAFDLQSKHPHMARRMHMLYGQQSKADRAAAVNALNPDMDPGEPVGVVGSPQAGGAALNLSGANIAISLSHDFNLRVFLQARGRIDRPGQRNKIQYVDVVATGPKGQRTIDHHILAALRGKDDIAKWTTATWRQKLQEE
jgi:SNF2 family DNA or RNA helicase